MISPDYGKRRRTGYIPDENPAIPEGPLFRHPPAALPSRLAHRAGFDRKLFESASFPVCHSGPAYCFPGRLLVCRGGAHGPGGRPEAVCLLPDRAGHSFPGVRFPDVRRTLSEAGLQRYPFEHGSHIQAHGSLSNGTRALSSAAGPEIPAEDAGHQTERSQRKRLFYDVGSAEYHAPEDIEGPNDRYMDPVLSVRIRQTLFGKSDKLLVLRRDGSEGYQDIKNGEPRHASQAAAAESKPADVPSDSIPEETE